VKRRRELLSGRKAGVIKGEEREGPKAKSFDGRKLLAFFGGREASEKVTGGVEQTGGRSLCASVCVSVLSGGL